jgi:regulator of cell morphogenesis and NO signaling
MEVLIMNFNKNDKVGDIVTRFPKASEVFQSHKIDYCCGGHKSLIEVTSDQNIEVDQVLLDLNKYYNQVGNTSNKDWVTADLNELVNHILQEHHAFLHTNLPIISELLRTILRVHGTNHPELLKVYQKFQTLKTEFEVHLIKEETIQYPAIDNYLKSLNENDLKLAQSVIVELENEHEVAGNLIKEINELTNDYSIPNDGCETYAKAYNLLKDMEQNTFTHIHLENNILFPRLLNTM